jgi:hypothetical protein
MLYWVYILLILTFFLFGHLGLMIALGIGSPIGATLSYLLLLQHKHDFGIKTVFSITVFRDYKGDQNHMADIQLLYHIEDVDVPRDEDVDMGDAMADMVRGEKREEEKVVAGGNFTRMHRVVLGSAGEWRVSSGLVKREL